MDLSNLKKIAIIGCSGSGKTTLSLQLANILKLPVIHLDQYYWLPNWQERPFEEFYTIHNNLCEQDEWIMEGTYTRALYPRIFHADMIIFLNLSRYQCIKRVLKRLMLNYGKTCNSVSKNCPERFDIKFLRWVWNFNKRSRNLILQILNENKDEKMVHILKSQNDIDEFVRSMLKHNPQT